MNLSRTAQNLKEEFERTELIDAHEHLPPERVRVAMPVDIFTLFSQYTPSDLFSAGMTPQQYAELHNAEVPLHRRWQVFEPFFRQIRFGSYARPALIAAKEFYGCDDISADTYRVISERMVAGNTPGIYHRILRQKCGIRLVLTQSKCTKFDTELLVPLMSGHRFFGGIRSRHVLEAVEAKFQFQARSLDDFLALVRKAILQWKSEGIVGLKMPSQRYGEPHRGLAEEAFSRMRAGATELPQHNPLKDFIGEEIIKTARDENLVMAVHAGMWGDFRELDPRHLIPILQRHPDVRFDLYHGGMPYVRYVGVMGKNFPNVWLNLCWSHVISPVMTCSFLDEWMDLVPVNKIIAFGGDYGKPVEKVYGHLQMARENIATVLGRRIDQGLINREEALRIARQWFFENPKELYRLKV